MNNNAKADGGVNPVVFLSSWARYSEFKSIEHRIEVNTPMKNSHYYPFPKYSKVEEFSKLTCVIQSRILNGCFIIYVSFKHQSKQTLPRSK